MTTHLASSLALIPLTPYQPATYVYADIVA